jgi:hypothetical protein
MITPYNRMGYTRAIYEVKILTIAPAACEVLACASKLHDLSSIITIFPFNSSGLFTDVQAVMGSADTTRPVILNSKGPVDLSAGEFK